MKQFFALLGVFVFLVDIAIPAEEAPSRRVSGRLRFVVDAPTISSFEFSFFDDHEKVVDRRNMRTQSPHVFDFVVSADYVRFALKIIEPEGFVTTVPFYSRSDGVRGFRGDVNITRRVDGFVFTMRNLSKFESRDRILALEHLKNNKWAGNPSEQAELHRTLAREYLRTGEYRKQQVVLGELFSIPGFQDLDQRKRIYYWRERFDGFLISARYNELKLPDRGFARQVVIDPEKLKAWSEFVSDFSTSFPGLKIQVQSIDFRTIESQVRTIDNELEKLITQR